MAIKMNDSAVDHLARDARQKTLTIAGEKLATRCIEEAPERTGNLKRKTAFDPPRGTMRVARVKFDAPYSSYVVVGTSRMSGNNFPTRAIEAVGASV